MAAARSIDDLDLDRLQAPPGEIRVLLSPDDARRLIDNGFEVNLVGAHPVQPINSSLVMTDSQANAWMTNRLKGTKHDMRTFVDMHSYSELVLYPWGHAPMLRSLVGKRTSDTVESLMSRRPRPSRRPTTAKPSAKPTKRAH